MSLGHIFLFALTENHCKVEDFTEIMNTCDSNVAVKTIFADYISFEAF